MRPGECGKIGSATRVVRCTQDHTNTYYSDSSCAAQPKPETVRPCTVTCTYAWYTGPLGRCLGECGSPGLKLRSVECRLDGTDKAVDDASLCGPPASKPADRELCDPCGSEWQPGAWGSCLDRYGGLVTCGLNPSFFAEKAPSSFSNGTRHRSVDCVTTTAATGDAGGAAPTTTTTRVAEALCAASPVPKPASSEECRVGLEPCTTFQWVVGNFGACVGYCGASGTQVGFVWVFAFELAEMELREEKRRAIRAEAVERSRAQEIPPPLFSLFHPYHEHAITEPPPLSSPQNRTVVCVATGNAANGPVSDALCRGPKPSTIQPCSSAPCTFSWRAGAWGPCQDARGVNVTCGGSATKSRTVLCVSSAGIPVAESFCGPTPAASSASSSSSAGKKPETVAQCALPQCPAFEFRARPWGPCLGVCGSSSNATRGGLRTRQVVCRDLLAGTDVPESYCFGVGIGIGGGAAGVDLSPAAAAAAAGAAAAAKPAAQESCEPGACMTYSYVPGEWSECSAAPCSGGGGVRSRARLCVDALLQPVPLALCAGAAPATFALQEVSSEHVPRT